MECYYNGLQAVYGGCGGVQGVYGDYGLCEVSMRITECTGCLCGDYWVSACSSLPVADAGSDARSSRMITFRTKQY